MNDQGRVRCSKGGAAPRRAGALLLAAAVFVAALSGAACGEDAPPADDLEYLVWEVCRQVRIPGTTADQVSGILQDAARHGAVMYLIEAECGGDIAAVFSES